ncbi:MAG: hypothetical protein DRQ51_01925 [Gammaproteobacteria bacterium]|nr:MAG: hypothetical protein DRQ51_01925 [Gammaproteobacteria bacterium]
MRDNLIIVIYKFFGRLSFPTIQKVGSLVGLILYLIPNKQKKITQININMCYPDLTDKQKKELIKNHLKAVGMTLFESMYMWHTDKKEVEKLIQKPINQQIFKDALQKKEKIILAILHFGNWEIGILDFKKIIDVRSLYAPIKYKKLENYSYKKRIQLGWQLANGNKSGIKMLMQSLKNNQVIGIAADQVPVHGSGIFSQFFNNSAYTMTLMVQLALKNKATIIFTVMERLEKHEGFRMHYIKADKDIYNQDISIATKSMNKSLEKCIKINPAQYMWNYKKFKIQPDNKKNPYNF